MPASSSAIGGTKRPRPSAAASKRAQRKPTEAIVALDLEARKQPKLTFEQGTAARLASASADRITQGSITNGFTKTISSGLMPPPTRPAPLSHEPGRAPNRTEQSGEHPQETTDNAMWADLLQPRRKDDLGLHKRKVAQVETWLREALDGTPLQRKYRRVLVLTGPAGSGKTAVLRALSSHQELDFDIVEWQNEASFRGDANIPITGDDLSGRFPTLALSASPSKAEDDHAPSPPSPIAQPTCTPNETATNGRRRIILVEDLPNVTHAPTRASFAASVAAFLSRPCPARSPPAPLVLVISETVPRGEAQEWGEAAGPSRWRERLDSIIDARRLLGDEVRRHPAYAEIRFNAVAPTILAKALRGALEIAHLRLPRRAAAALPKPTSLAAKMLTDMVAEDADGDLRSAINTLQLACSASGALDDWPGGAKGSARGKKRMEAAKGGEARIREEIRKRLSDNTGREKTLNLFHAVGRVLYNKRFGDPDEDTPSASARSSASDDAQEPLAPPAHLAHLARRKSRVDVNDLWTSMSVEASMLKLFLQQNYVQFTEELEQCSDVAEAISFAEAELRPRDEHWQHAALTSQYDFLVTVQSLLLYLPSPVPRTGQRLGKSGLLAAASRAKEHTALLSELEHALGVGDLGGVEGRPGGEEVRGLTSMRFGGSESWATETVPMLYKIQMARDGTAATRSAASAAGGGGKFADSQPTRVGRREARLLKLLSSAASLRWESEGPTGADETLGEDGDEGEAEAAAADAGVVEADEDGGEGGTPTWTAATAASSDGASAAEGQRGSQIAPLPALGGKPADDIWKGVDPRENSREGFNSPPSGRQTTGLERAPPLIEEDEEEEEEEIEDID